LEAASARIRGSWGVAGKLIGGGGQAKMLIFALNFHLPSIYLCPVLYPIPNCKNLVLLALARVKVVEGGHSQDANICHFEFSSAFQYILPRAISVCGVLGTLGILGSNLYPLLCALDNYYYRLACFSDINQLSRIKI
jgi:hypothetical protein